MGYQVDFETTASFDVDPQNCFTPVCPEELPVPEGTAIVPELNAQAKLARVRVASRDAHNPNAVWVAGTNNLAPFDPVEGENVDIAWPLHAVPGTLGFEFIAGLPDDSGYDFVVNKGVEPDMHPYGALYRDLADTMSTGVKEYLTSQGVKTVIVGGLATDYCVKTTVLQLRDAGFEVVVNLGACRGIAEETVSDALNQMREAGAVLVASASEISN